LPVQHLLAATAAWAQGEAGTGESHPKAEEHLGRQHLSCRAATLIGATAILELPKLAMPSAGDTVPQELWRSLVEVVLPSLPALRAPVEAASARDSSTKTLRRQRPWPRRGAAPREGVAPSMSFWAAVSAVVLMRHDLGQLVELLGLAVQAAAEHAEAAAVVLGQSLRLPSVERVEQPANVLPRKRRKIP